MPDLTLTELQGLRDALVRARLSGQRSVSYDGREVTFASDREMRAALADAERRIADFGATPRVSQVRISSSKGL